MGALSATQQQQPCGKPPVYPYKNVLKFGSKQQTPLLQWPEQQHKQQRHKVAERQQQTIRAHHNQQSSHHAGVMAQPEPQPAASLACRQHHGMHDAGKGGAPRSADQASAASGCSIESSGGSSSSSSSSSSSGDSTNSSGSSSNDSSNRPAAVSTSYTRGRGLMNRSFQRFRPAMTAGITGRSEIQPKLELQMFKGQRQLVDAGVAPCMTEAALEKQWQESWVGVPRRRHGQSDTATHAAPGCTDERNPLLVHMQQSSGSAGGVMVNPLPAAMGAVSGGPWVVVAGVVLGAALSGGAVAVAFGLASWATKAALVYGFAWKTATGAAALEGLCVGGISSAKLQAAREQAASMQHQLVHLCAQASRQANTYAELVHSATLRHEEQVAGLIELNERLVLVADSLRSENRGLHVALEQRAAELTMHKEALLAEREHGGAMRADMRAMAGHQERLLGALEALRGDMAGMKGQASGWVGSDAVLANQQAASWPSSLGVYV